MHRSPAALGIVLLLALAPAACGPAAPRAGTAAPGLPATSTASPVDTATVPGSMVGSNPDPSALLSVADVRKATGLSGLRLTDKTADPKAIGRLNFAGSDGTLVLIVNIGDRYAFDDSKAGMNFGAAVTGVGEDAYVGPSDTVSATKSIVAARAGDHAIILRTFAKSTAAGAGTWLTIGQLEALATLILSRWG